MSKSQFFRKRRRRRVAQHNASKPAEILEERRVLSAVSFSADMDQQSGEQDQESAAFREPDPISFAKVEYGFTGQGDNDLSHETRDAYFAGDASNSQSKLTLSVVDVHDGEDNPNMDMSAVTLKDIDSPISAGRTGHDRVFDDRVIPAILNR